MFSQTYVIGIDTLFHTTYDLNSLSPIRDRAFIKREWNLLVLVNLKINIYSKKFDKL